jgi:hypothetical protein
LGCIGKVIPHRQMRKEEIKDQIWTRSTVANSNDSWKAFQTFVRYACSGSGSSAFPSLRLIHASSASEPPTSTEYAQAETRFIIEPDQVTNKE